MCVLAVLKECVLAKGLGYWLCLEGIELVVCVLARGCVYWVACNARVF